VPPFFSTGMVMDQFSHDPEAFASPDDPQRGDVRDSLLLSAQLCLPVMATPVTVRVRNLSSGGLMAEHAGRAAIGDAVKIEVRGIGWIDGRVAWITAGRLGIAFDTEIDPLLARKPVAVSLKSRTPAKRVRAIL
jgi:hypothetical protein